MIQAAVTGALLLSLVACAPAKPAAVSFSHSPAARPTATPSVPSPGLKPFQAGAITYAFGSSPEQVTQSKALLDRLAGLKVNAVGLAFPLFQSGWRTGDVHIDPVATPNSDFFATFVTEAHRRGIAVLLRPLVDETSLHPAHWRGDIKPDDPAAWFASYQATMVTYARLAEADKVEVLDIGTELTSMQGYAAQWRGVVAAVKEVYRGQVTYSANWDTPYPAFGDSLDFIGVDAFFPLQAPRSASVDQLVAAWKPWQAKLSQIAQQWGKKVVLTELGTTSEPGSYQSPYTWNHADGVSLADQQSYYAATCRALKPQVSGMYWWAFYLAPVPNPTTDAGYDPQGKPAEQEIGRCYA